MCLLLALGELTQRNSKSPQGVPAPGAETLRPHDAKCRSGANSLCRFKSVLNALNRKALS